jgi:hypothetical protein
VGWCHEVWFTDAQRDDILHLRSDIKKLPDARRRHRMNTLRNTASVGHNFLINTPM